MNFKILAATVLVSANLGSVSLAQLAQNSDPRHIGIANLYDAVYVNDSLFLAAKTEVLAEREGVSVAKGGNGFSLGVHADAHRGRDFTHDESYSGGELSLNLTKPLYNRANSLAVTKAEMQTQLADLKLLLAQQDLVLRTAVEYFEILAMQIKVQVSVAQEEFLTKLYDLEKVRYDRGLTTKQNMTRVMADLRVAQSESRKNQSNLESRYYDLGQKAGFQIKGFRTLPEDSKLDYPNPSNREAWASQAERSSLQVQMQEVLYDMARVDIEMARAEYSPTVDFYASAGVYRSRDHFQGGASSYTSREARIGIVMDWPIWTGPGRSSQTRKASYEAEKFAEDRNAAVSAASSYARQCYTDTVSSLEKTEALKEAYVASRESFEANNESYEAGLTPLPEVLVSQQLMYQTRKDYELERLNAVLSSLKLKFATGQLYPGDLLRIDSLLQQN